MLDWIEDEFFIPTQLRLGTHGPDTNNRVRDINSRFEEDYRKLRQNYEKQLRSVC